MRLRESARSATVTHAVSAESPSSVLCTSRTAASLLSARTPVTVPSSTVSSTEGLIFTHTVAYAGTAAGAEFSAIGSTMARHAAAVANSAARRTPNRLRPPEARRTVFSSVAEGAGEAEPSVSLSFFHSSVTRERMSGVCSSVSRFNCPIISERFMPFPPFSSAQTRFFLL